MDELNGPTSQSWTWYELFWWIVALKVNCVLWSSQEVDYNQLQPFAAPLFYRAHAERDKLKPRYLPGLLMGYETNTSNYRVWDISKHTIIITQDLRFPKPSHIGPLAPTLSSVSPPSSPIYIATPISTNTPSTEQNKNSPRGITDEENGADEVVRDRGSYQNEQNWRGWAIGQDPRFDRSPAPSPPLPVSSSQIENTGPRRSQRQAGHDAEHIPWSLEESLALPSNADLDSITVSRILPTLGQRTKDMGTWTRSDKEYT
ncbi:hypothetical protein TREMEDRAFT_66357 [Tremella mesenterica DSM 1558]|uniref:uncharacterized protein n=1 Tax=Tremella mesenterica (strain ATCC 24925 / CBS 8224 / DSM 1558 / NBRC 9311 / NRRL Y-6157 / RJB 2259-6 / UBC 559-6) TaxID=578456 RepID=UPI00032D26EF|nr:uncharacterized protein TREMEDRAFT_66357 [Tremella mesenterica DSM 1558]EIW65634.1 hypothetical protein TREMEDRAFT_66357 [Tremella mesenterica DSM 1558]